MPRRRAVSTTLLALLLASSAPARAELKLFGSDTAALDRFGQHVAISGDTAVASAPEWTTLAVGLVYVYDRDLGGPNAWGQVARLRPTPTQFGHFFGSDVAIDGDLLIAGASGDDGAGEQAGAAFVFARDAGGPDAWGQLAQIWGSDTAAGDRFGVSVALSGDTAIVGTTYHALPGGAAYVFERNEGCADCFGEVAMLKPTADSTGYRVAISGDVAAVGAWRDDLPAPSTLDAGAVYLFGRDEGGAGAWGQLAELRAGDPGASDYFGRSVALDGDTLVVGAPGQGASPTEDAGAAYVFRRDPGDQSWDQVAKLVAADPLPDQSFGVSVSIAGDTIAVAARGDDLFQVRDGKGAAYVFSRNVGGAEAWGQVAKLTAPDAAPGDHFADVATTEYGTLVGVPEQDELGENAGAAYGFALYQACGNGVDEDGDGAADYPADPGCLSAEDGSERQAELICDDGIDNDGDGLVDFIDGDGDGIADPPGDPGCNGLTGLSENPACQDGIDNDGDGYVDGADPACRFSYSPREATACQDGIDNDGRDGTDFDGGESIHGVGNGDPAGPDPLCVGRPWHLHEAAYCGLGAELAIVLPLLLAARRRRRAPPA